MKKRDGRGIHRQVVVTPDLRAFEQWRRSTYGRRGHPVASVEETAAWEAEVARVLAQGRPVPPTCVGVCQVGNNSEKGPKISSYAAHRTALLGV
jgi:hypothetical protein